MSAQSPFPSGAFVHPDGRNIDEAKGFARRVVDLALELRASSADRGASPKESPPPIDVTLAESPLSEDEIVKQLKVLLDGAANPESPSFAAHMGAFPTAISALGDFVASTLNNNLIGLELSPTFSRLEEGLAKEFARYFGLPETAGGLIATGGSLSNLHAMTVARNHVLGVLHQGIHQLSGAPVLFASESAHASVEKNAMILGLGREGLVRVATNAQSQMDVADLRRKIQSAKTKGQLPFCVVATAGTTVTGNIDKMEEIAEVAREHGLWFHADAAWGGGLQFCDQYRDRLAGIELADSITFCPQKLLLVALSSSLTLFRRWDQMEDAFRIAFCYLKNTSSFTDRSEIGVQGSRPAEVLKLWLSMQHIGTTAYGNLIAGWVELADAVADAVKEREHMEVVSTPESAIVCFRSHPPGLGDEAANEWNASLRELVLERTGIYLSTVSYQKRTWLRAVFQNPFIDRGLVDRLFACIDEIEAERAVKTRAAETHGEEDAGSRM